MDIMELVSLCDDDSIDKFKTELANFQNTRTRLLQESKIILPLNEATFQSIITWVCSKDKFLFGNELRIPKHGTKLDIVIYNDKSGVILELKRQPHAVEDAVKQIFKNHYCDVFKVTKYFNDRQKTPSLSLVMGMHVNSENKASVMCLRKKDIIDVLDSYKIGAEPSLESRIDAAVDSIGEELFNTFCRRAIRC